MRKRIRPVVAAVTALVLTLAGCPAVFAADAQPEEIHIRTAADLAELAKNCSLDTWSDGRQVVLDNDISMAGLDFSPIPVFNGVFDGGGHMIADLELTAPMSPCGLFLETGKDAEIRLLTVSGNVEPAGDNDRVGGIVGLNRGTVSGCLFNGSVSGRSCVGAVAGQNEATGLITACRASGTVFGLGQAGGIVGQNNGSVMECENRSFVNTKSIDPSLRLDELDTSSLLNLFGSVTRENADITSNIGGIAGGNDGLLSSAPTAASWDTCTWAAMWAASPGAAEGTSAAAPIPATSTGAATPGASWAEPSPWSRCPRPRTCCRGWDTGCTR